MLLGVAKALFSMEMTGLKRVSRFFAIISASALKQLKIPFILLVVGVAFAVLSPGSSDAGDFSRWLQAFRTEALTAGISANILDNAFADLKEPLSRVIELDRRQAETLQTRAEYLAARVTPERVKSGKRMLTLHQACLKDIEREYGVQPHFLVALWGLETHYGQHTGDFSVIQSLATLAYDGRRSGYFRRELMQALRILDKGHISPASMRGSWAGAMGHCQFMPSTFLRLAVDADGDGRIDLWGSIPDALASAANYLAAERWRGDQTWGFPVVLPADFDHNRAGLNKRLSPALWQDLGIRRLDGSALPQHDPDASLVLPDTPNGQAYLIFDNFRALMRWNRSVSFAISVGTLADEISAW
jgi:membrane-bound lytic murein transglycosylase B